MKDEIEGIRNEAAVVCFNGLECLRITTKTVARIVYLEPTFERGPFRVERRIVSVWTAT